MKVAITRRKEIAKGLTSFTALALGAQMFFGCGGNVGSTNESIDNSGDNSGASSSQNSSSGGSSGTSGETTDETTGIPSYEFRVGTVGYNGTSVQVSVRRVLKVSFTPGVQDEKIQDTGWSPQYSMLGVYITVGTTSQATPMLYNGYNGTAIEESAAMDFSTSFTAECPEEDTSCRQYVTIEIGKPNYDYWCLNYGYYCQWTHVHSTHPWHGTLKVQTDDTDPL